MPNFIIQKDLRLSQIVPLISLQTLNILIGLLMLLQLCGETLQNKILMSLKPLPIILLIIKSLYFVECKQEISYGLIFSLFGDILLMAKNFIFFKVGTVCFIITHFFYIKAFLSDFRTSKQIFTSKKSFSIISTILVIMFLIMNNLVLWQELPDKLLFPLYSIVLSSMVISSFYRYNQFHNRHYFVCVIGAVLFMLSDSLIAHTKLDSLKIDYSGTLIMIMYYLGQHLILHGVSGEKEIQTLKL